MCWHCGSGILKDSRCRRWPVKRSVSKRRVGGIHLPGFSLCRFLSGLLSSPLSPSLPFIVAAVLHPSLLLGLHNIRCWRGTLTAVCCWGSVGTGLHLGGGWLLRCGKWLSMIHQVIIDDSSSIIKPSPDFGLSLGRSCRSLYSGLSCSIRSLSVKENISRYDKKRRKRLTWAQMSSNDELVCASCPRLFSFPPHRAHQLWFGKVIIDNQLSMINPLTWLEDVP